MGVLDVDGLLESIPSDLLSEWLAFELVEVSDARRAGALVASTIANVMGEGKRHWTEADFLPRTAGPAEEQDFEEMKGAFRALKGGR